MATVENFVVKVDTQGVEKLDRLGGVAESLRGKMDLLRTTILGLGFGAFIANAIRAADAIVDLSDATDITVGSIINFGNALQAAGGQSKNAEKNILTFFNSIDTALSGSDKARDSFGKLGISLQDLKTRSEADLLSQAIEGLARMEKGAQRTALASDIFGRSMRAIEVDTFVESLRTGKETADQAAEAMITSAKAVGEMEKEIIKLQQGALQALVPLMKLFGETGITAEGAATAFKVLGALIALSFGAAAIANVVAFNKAIGLTAAIANIIGKSPVGIIAKGIALGATGAAAAAAAIALDDFLKANEAIDQQAKSAAGQDPRLIVGKNAGGVDRTAELSARDRAILESAKRTSESEANIRRDLALSTANELQAIRINANAEIEKLNLDFNQREKESGISLAAERAARIKEINNKAAIEEARFRRQLDIRIMTDQMAEAEQNAKDMAAYYQEVDRARLAAFEQTSALTKTNEELRGRFELQQRIADLGTIEADRQTKIFDIQLQQKAALEAISKIPNLPYDERLQKEEEINAKFRERIELINEEGDARIARENDFSAGLKNSMKRYEESLTPLKRGEAMADSVFNNMGSALDRFVETGKLSFGDFARSVIMDMLKIELRAAAMKMFQAAGGLSGIAGLFGFARGGMIPTEGPVLVGEEGPELIMGAAGRQVIPNNQLGTAPSGGNVTNNYYSINAVDAKSVAQLFAENRMTLLGNVRQAEKELPIRGR